MQLKSAIKYQILRKFSLEDFYTYLNKSWTRNSKHIYIACLPKSGSTFLTDVLVNVSEFQFVQFQPIRGTNDHNINYDVLLSNLNNDTVTQLHTKPNDHNRLLFKKYNIKVVFLFRSIINSLKSFHSHILNENDRWFMFSVADNFIEWDIEKQFDFIIELVGPWYIDFLVSWKKELQKNEIEILEVDFDDFKSDNINTIRRILEFYELYHSSNRIEEGLKRSMSRKEKLRFNSETSKIDYEFTNNQIEKLKGFLSYYPEHQIKL